MQIEQNIQCVGTESKTEFLIAEVARALSAGLPVWGEENQLEACDDRRVRVRLGSEGASSSLDGASLDRIAHSLAMMIDAKSPWTCAHSEGVAEIAAGIAETMEMSPREIRDIRRAGLLHDVGKLGVPNAILDKPGKLSPAETAEMRKHTGYTYQILRRVPGFEHLATIAASHHERLDGKGYHRGVGADQLSTAARILAVADKYEALTATRPYRVDLSPRQALDILEKNCGPDICPIVFAALKRYLSIGGCVAESIAA